VPVSSPEASETVNPLENTFRAVKTSVTCAMRGMSGDRAKVYGL